MPVPSPDYSTAGLFYICLTIALWYYSIVTTPLKYGFENAGSYWKNGEVSPFPIMSGRDLYNHRSLTGQNRSPIADLISYTLAGMRGPDVLPFDPDEVCELRLVDGSGATFNGRWLPDVFADDESFFIQYLRDDDYILDFRVDGADMTQVKANRWREWSKAEAWSVHDVYFDEMGRVKKTEPVSIAGLDTADIRVYPNDRGILYYPQEVFWLLEESKATQRRLMRGSNVLPIIDSDAAAETWGTAFNTARNAVVAPYDKINFPVSSSTMQALTSESDGALSNWLDSLNVVEKDAPQRPSGRDREIRTRAMVNFIRTLRDDIKAIYQDFGIAVEFTEQVIIASAAERIQELDLIERLEASRTLAPNEANELKRKLV